MNPNVIVWAVSKPLSALRTRSKLQSASAAPATGKQNDCRRDLRGDEDAARALNRASRRNGPARAGQAGGQPSTRDAERGQHAEEQA